MSYFDDASLVLIPSGYKDQKIFSVKPLDGSGDLTFSRASSATRVASNGLIEKVRTNLVTYSEAFDNAAWTKVGLTISANAAISPDGTTTADKSIIDNGVTIGSTTTYCRTAALTLTTGVTYVVSVYAKEDGFDSLVVRQTTSAAMGAGPTLNVVVNMTTGVAASASFGSYLGRVAASNGYYRYSFLTNSIASATNYLSISAQDSVATVGDGTKGILVWGAMAEIGDVMTDYIATTTAAVSVGPVSGLPRLDYLGSTCPRLLLEPQRSNLQINSENAGSDWGAVSGVDITANQIASPDGFVNADLIAANSSTINHIFEKAFSATNGTSYSISYFAKANTNNQCFIFGYADNSVFAGQIAVFNLTDGTIVSNTGGGIAKIENYGNGWYRVCLTLTAGATATGFYGIGLAKNGARQWTSDGTSIYMWGVQFEAGAYATSYIPTLGTSVTRVADAASKTGISSLIGQTEGTIFAEVDFDAAVNTEGYIFRIDESSFDDTIFVSRGDDKILNGILRTGGSTIVQLQKTAFNGVNKLAFAYKSGSFALYVNGTQVATSAATYTNGITYDDIRIGGFNATTANMCGGIKQLLLFRTRLSNSDLAALTA